MPISILTFLNDNFVDDWYGNWIATGNQQWNGILGDIETMIIIMLTVNAMSMCIQSSIIICCVNCNFWLPWTLTSYYIDVHNELHLIIRILEMTKMKREYIGDTCC